MKGLYFSVLCAVTMVMSCSKANESERVEAYTIPQIERLVIDERPDDDDNDPYEVQFFYDDQGRVEQAKINRLFNVQQDYDYDENGNLSGISFWYEDQDLLSAGERYILSYEDNQLKTVERISRPLISMDVDVKYSYAYDSNQNLESITSTNFIGTDSEFKSEERFEWGQGGALNNTKSFREGELTLEFDYRNDNAHNPFRGNPYFIEQAIFHTSRNITESSAIDYIGTYDPVCLVCQTTYEYNDEGFPTKITKPWQETTIVYK